jgi:ATP-dependent exoDNAse (exonuclease V) beta subunit
MSSTPTTRSPLDIGERRKALDTSASILVQAPAGSGKTSLLTQRFLALLGKVDDPRHIVAITFTTAAAAEMRHRILSALALAADNDPAADPLAVSALAQDTRCGWKLLNQPALLRISTIDSFCREIALQQPLLSRLGGGLSIAEQPQELYRKAANRTMAGLSGEDNDLRTAISDLLLWRDNSWHELSNQIVEMLATRDRWMQGFVFDVALDESALRAGLERPFARAIAQALSQISGVFSTNECVEIVSLASFASMNLQNTRFSALAQANSLPSGPFDESDLAALEAALALYQEVADLLLTHTGDLRKQVTKNEGFPAKGGEAQKAQMLDLLKELAARPYAVKALVAVNSLPPVHYSEDEWRIVRGCFVLLRNAAAHLKAVFAEAGKCDFTEIAQIAQLALSSTGEAGEGAFALADDIHHLLIDEFQDTSRRQHRLLAGIVDHWQERTGRTCFVVGDPMQSIYFFRDADAELFPRVHHHGLELGNGDALSFNLAQLTANFRTEPALVNRLNNIFTSIFSFDDGSGLVFTDADPARAANAAAFTPLGLHLDFVLATSSFGGRSEESIAAAEAAEKSQIDKMLEVVRQHLPFIEQAKLENRPYRIAVLGRAHKSLAPVAAALREAGIRFRAVDLEPLTQRPEVLDALALGRALLNREDRIAWLGVLRAPWCGLSLEDLHSLVSEDSRELLSRTVPEVAAERLSVISSQGQTAVKRVLDAAEDAWLMRAANPTQSLGAWLESVWMQMGGAACVDSTARVNLDLLWNVLDKLPSAEQDFLGPALDAALKELTAQPDPEASSEHGVQLMTIHKSKGLEFEVVLLPDLDAKGGSGNLKMVSWLERGLTDSEDGVLTEFCVAPFQTKGEKGGAAKKWVDSVYRERERQESRRVLYVAMTRAKNELHLFAQVAFKVKNDEAELAAPTTDSLLLTAWAGIREDVVAQFSQWYASANASLPMPVVAQPAAANNTIVKRLSADAAALACAGENPILPSRPIIEAVNQRFELDEGGIEARVFGIAVHALLEEAARRRKTLSWDDTRKSLADKVPAIAALIRSNGLNRSEAERLSKEAHALAIDCTNEPNCQWVLDPQCDGESEVRWTAIHAGRIRGLQADRIFRAGSSPLATGQDCYWIVDYKTGSSGTSAADIAAMRERHAPQLEMYASAIRQLHGNNTLIRTAIYYPRLRTLDWWVPLAA